MKYLIFVLPIFFLLNGCIYINQDVGPTTYKYDKCKEYYDANGTYHKDCPYTLYQNINDCIKCVKIKYFGKNKCSCKECLKKYESK